MIDLGVVRPGSTIYVPFATYDSNDPSASVTITGLAVTDIEVYKNLGTTQRASDSGYTLADTDGIDIDGVTGIHGFSIDLADNTDSGFWVAGAHYTVVVASITVDAATINFIPVMFRIGYAGAILDTTIATLASQTSFTLTAGPAEADALNGMPCIIHDAASAVQIAKGVISDYAVTTKTVTLAFDPGIFTMAAGDNISVFIGDALSFAARANLEAAADGSGYNLGGGSIVAASVTGAVGSVTGAVGSVTGAVGSVTGNVGGNVAGSVASVTGNVGGNVVGSVASVTGNVGGIAGTITTLDALDTAQDTQHSTTQGKVDTAQADLDLLTGADGATLATSQPNYAPNTTTPPTVGAIADAVWDEAVAGHVSAGTFGATDAAILADTNELQTDWANGGRLDLLIDAIKAVTDVIPDSGAMTSIATASALSTVDTVVDAIKVITDALGATAAARLALSAGVMVPGTVDTVTNGHTPTTTEFQADDITEATADHYIGRIVIFTSGVLQYQATDITDYAAVGGIGQFTVTAMTEAPSNDDTFIIL